MNENDKTAMIQTDREAPQYSGRVDGSGAQHLRWNQLVTAQQSGDIQDSVALLGFCSDAGVKRNQGRVGASDGPAALRAALSPMAIHNQRELVDLGDVVVEGDELESGQERLAGAVTQTLNSGAFPIVLGGGHETAYGTGLGLLQHLADDRSTRIGILNLDAHFDLRDESQRTSGTPFLDLYGQMVQQGRDFHYAVLGISRPGNTVALFNKVEELGVPYLLDEDCEPAQIREFVAAFLERIDVLYLTIDLDVLPASVAPGVSAPAGFGVPFERILSVCRQVVASGKVVVAEVVELNPRYDIDSRTARSAARLIYEIAVG
ncbi:formimidoylglutamase [Glutamicibacter sp.]|uniref:formimidoylglutamase n=1 Tax=Glutamicibacter sp. TaxID=1931995 RepID=UPI003FA60D13